MSYLHATKHYTPAEIGGSETLFEIPIYQRLFEWNPENIRTLLKDLEAQMDQHREGDYYIGMLTSKKSEGSSRVALVDGQQRFTIMMLMACVLRQVYPEWNNFLLYNGAMRVTFDARPEDMGYLNKLIEDHAYIKDVIAGHIVDDSGYNAKMRAGIMTIGEYMNGLQGNASRFAEYIYQHMAFFIAELPDRYRAGDLNKYFERMNSSGKNLEQHEVLKVKLLRNLTDENDDIPAYMHLWDEIADTDRLLITKGNMDEDMYKSKKKDAFSNTYHSPIWDLVHEYTCRKLDEDSGLTINQIAPSQEKPRQERRAINGTRCPVKFPQLLLLTLYYSMTEEKREEIENIDNFFDTGKLSQSFLPLLCCEGDCGKDRIRYFMRLLLRCRLALDICFVRLQDPGYELDMVSSERADMHKELTMLESMLLVSSSNSSNYTWFCNLMDILDEYQAVPSPADLYIKLKEKTDNARELPLVDDLNYGRKTDPTVALRYWFWRLDFEIWLQRKDLFAGEENERLLDVANHYLFVRNRSIEHIAPQTPKDGSIITWENLQDSVLCNGFGNLVMISQSANSELSNSSYEIKRAHVLECANGKSTINTIESLKLLLVYRDFKNGWGKEQIEKHKIRSYNILANAFNKEPLPEEDNNITE